MEFKDPSQPQNFARTKGQSFFTEDKEGNEGGYSPDNVWRNCFPLNLRWLFPLVFIGFSLATRRILESQAFVAFVIFCKNIVFVTFVSLADVAPALLIILFLCLAKSALW